MVDQLESGLEKESDLKIALELEGNSHMLSSSVSTLCHFPQSLLYFFQ